MVTQSEIYDLLANTFIRRLHRSAMNELVGEIWNVAFPGRYVGMEGLKGRTF
jgi:hypothetical protein